MAGSTKQTTQTATIITNQFIEPVLVEVKSIEDLVRDSVNQYGLTEKDFKDIWETMGCETQYTYDPHIQSRVRYNFSDKRRGIVIGEQEKSYGLAMIHLPDHPTITLEQATDAEFSINFMVSNWTKHKTWWYCWSNNN